MDSELALLYRRLTGISVPTNGPVPNPYFARSAEEIKSAKPFNRAIYDTYLVTRLDGFTMADALGLITRGLTPRQDGRILMDAPLVTGDPRIGWMGRAANRLRDSGFADRVVVENTSRALQNEAEVLGYMSWGSNDPALYVRHPSLRLYPAPSRRCSSAVTRARSSNLPALETGAAASSELVLWFFADVDCRSDPKRRNWRRRSGERALCGRCRSAGYPVSRI